jgi:hypothetical protein
MIASAPAALFLVLRESVLERIDCRFVDAACFDCASAAGHRARKEPR